MLHPKVNDLHTADITRELAQRLGAGAIINAGMDGDRLDLNRLSQVMERARHGCLSLSRRAWSESLSAAGARWCY